MRSTENNNLTADEEDAEISMPGHSIWENKFLRKKHASNFETDKIKSQDSHFQRAR